MKYSQHVLEQACAIAGMDAESARLLRIGSNAVYRLSVPVIARISALALTSARCAVPWLWPGG